MWTRVPERRRYDFDVDMLLLQTFGLRNLPDEVADRIFDLADRETSFRWGLHKAMRFAHLAATGVALPRAKGEVWRG